MCGANFNGIACLHETIPILQTCLSHRNTSKKYNIMAFNAGDRVSCSTWTQVSASRQRFTLKFDMNN